MKRVKPKADYSVMVRPGSWDRPPELAHLYAGIFEMTLNVMVNVAFIPELPPVRSWDDSALPMDSDDIVTGQQARLDTALWSSYVVTPHEYFAGRHERFPQGGWANDGFADNGIVFYVTPMEFQRYGEELARMSEECDDPLLAESRTLATLQDRGVVRFVHGRIVTSGRLAPDDAAYLCVPGAAPTA